MSLRNWASSFFDGFGPGAMFGHARRAGAPTQAFADEEPEQDDRLAGFVYDILRDHLTAGVVESLVREAEPYKRIDFSNKHLEGYAKEIARRLTQ